MSAGNWDGAVGPFSFLGSDWGGVLLLLVQEGLEESGVEAERVISNCCLHFYASEFKIKYLSFSANFG